MKKIALAVLILVLTGCASHKKVNKFASNLPCNKVYHFTFDDSNRTVEIEKKGPHFGDSKVPNYHQTFRKSIEDLAANNNLRIHYVDRHSNSLDSVVRVNVKVERILWKFNLTSAVMETYLIYELPDQEISLIGKNKMYAMGTKKGNLFKSLKEGTYQFLLAVCH